MQTLEIMTVSEVYHLESWKHYEGIGLSKKKRGGEMNKDKRSQDVQKQLC